MHVKIEACTKELRQLRGDTSGRLFTGLKVNGAWVNMEGDHRNLYGKTVELTPPDHNNIVQFAQAQTPPAPAERPPLPPPTNGHTPAWATREDAADAWIFYATEVERYIKDPAAIVRAANCLFMQEAKGDINPVHRKSEP